MGKMYQAIFTDIAVVALQDFFEVSGSVDHIISIHGWEIFQITDVGDIGEEILRIETVRGVGSITSGSGGGVVTPQPVEDGFGSSTLILERNNTVRMTAGAGSLEILENFGWNIRIPLEKVYAPETRPIISPNDSWTLSLPANPLDSLTMSGRVVFEEIGGNL